MQNLQAHHKNKTHFYCPEVKWSIDSSDIHFTFIVKSSNGFYTNPNFGMDYVKNTNLWDFDVVEVFLNKGGESYLELQLSPLGQPFSYLIIKPRVECVIPSVLPVQMSTNLKENVLTANISVPISYLPGAGNSIYGGCFSCLGFETEYYSLNPNKEDAADFHRPELFIHFGEIKGDQ
jgi:hypothetical protein